MTERILLTVLMLITLPLATVAHTLCDGEADTTKWYNRTHDLEGITVSKTRTHYKRKNNPAVELMRRVIAAKKRTRLETRDYYRRYRYQKITFAANDVTTESVLHSVFGKLPDITSQIELCPYNNKLILPITFSETLAEEFYRKNPRDEKTVVKGERSGGVNKLFQTGEIITAALKDFFTDVDIYDDQIRLLQKPFTSPIGRDAIRFYQFTIIDTVAIERDSCIQVHFRPNNQRDFGFTGEVYVMKDSSYQVRRCLLSLPRKSEVNFVDGMAIVQEYSQLPDSTWALTTDDMAVELSLFDFLTKAIVVRNTRLGGYDFEPIDDEAFRGAEKTKREKGSNRRSDDYWEKNRPVALTPSERRMDSFIEGLKRGKAYGTVMFAAKILTENYVETGDEKHPSKVDIGPVNSMLSSNFIDGLRTRFSFQSTANLTKHWYFSGFYAYGWKSRRSYYNTEITYSFNEKDYLPDEYPMRSVTLSSTYDVCSPADKFAAYDKDNVFTSLKWTDVNKMMFYRRNELTFRREERFGLRSTLSLKTEENEACGELRYLPLATAIDRKMRTTEVRLELRYAPGETFVNTKQHRRPLNRDVPVLTLSHAMGMKGVLGGQYNYNFTEIHLFRRFWVKSWGKIDLDVAAGAQWNKVPFPLLCMPAANLSLISQYGTFGLVNNMEFMNDRYASLMLSWDMNGKIFNRLPLIKLLKWREYIGARTLWGTLTDKNNPYLPQNQQSDVLMAFPEGSYVMDKKRPYVELVFGIHNIFRFFQVEYVRRLNYLDLPTAKKHGVRFKFSLRF